MKKAAGKQKNVQALNPKGCMKISQFFTKQTQNKENSVDKANKNTNTSEIIVLDSDESQESTKNSVLTSPNSKKRKLTHSNSSHKSPPTKKSNTNSNAACKSPKAANGELKHVKVKSIDELLSPHALKQYKTPEKIMERFLEKAASPVAKKLNFDDASSSKSGASNDAIKKNVTPKKSLSNLEDDLTPTKIKKTPKKLFEKSPGNLAEFNVEIIHNFVKITPSKSNKKIFKKEDSAGKCSELSQLQNEKTPVKNSPSKKTSSPNKAKVKLNFGMNSPRKTSISPQKSTSAIKSENNTNLIQKNEFELNPNDFDFDDSLDGCFGSEIEYTLDLSVSHHCKITSVTHIGNKKTVIVKSTTNNQQAICNLDGFWLHSRLAIGDTIHLSAQKMNDSEWLIDNKSGLLVFEPDYLVSTTTIVNGVFCKRKLVLTEKYKGFDPTNKPMIVGTLVHDMLQQALRKKLTEYEEILDLVTKMITSENTVRQAYEANLSMLEIQEDLLNFAPKIVEFINSYVTSKNITKSYKNNKNNWQGIIKDIDDIEENIWCPELGIKGKIDVTVKTDFQKMPLELKTGRSTASLEHRGQVMLYIMMMNKLGYNNVSSGLLLYLRDGVLKEIPMTEAEKRDIIMLRNELTFYLTRPPIITEEYDQKSIRLDQIPEPIDHSFCAKCPYSNLCTTFAKFNNENISNNKTLKNIQDQVKSHIRDVHMEYFMKWSALIDLELSHKHGDKNLKDIYTKSPKERESKGRCIINLKVLNTSPDCNGIVTHTFIKTNDNSTPINLITSGINENAYVVISTNKRPAVASGFVSEITTQTITVSLERDLNAKFPDSVFHIDTYDSTMIQNFNMSSLSLLMELTPRADELRSIIIDRQMPTFQAKLPRIIAEKGKPILKRLDRVQQRAVLRAVSAKEYFLIEGMPGTGKTSTIVALIQLLLELNKTILITSHTHSAVDNVCIRLLKYGVKILRLGNSSKIDDSLKEYSEYNLTKDCKTPDELDRVYKNAQILAVTCLGSGHPILSKRTVDVCIVDESTQVVQSSVIRPIYSAKTFILIGDPHQLPPVIRNKDAVDLGMSESLFDRLMCEKSMASLTLNYRMNEPITALANVLTYNGALQIGAEHVAKATIKIPFKQMILERYKNYKWLIDALDNSLDNSVQLIDTGPVCKLNHEVTWRRIPSNEEEQIQSYSNVYEAALAYHLVEALLLGGVQPDKIGVMATYRAQVMQLNELILDRNVDVSTVDQFQGKDKEIVIYSCTKSREARENRSEKSNELLENQKRLTVAITRAKHKLIILGDKNTLSQFNTFQKILPLLEKNLISIKEDSDGFSWKNTLKINRR